MEEEKLITKSAELLTNMGFRQIASLQDEDGIHSTVFKNDEMREIYLVGSKKYAYKNLASFQARQVDLANEKSLMLVFYEDRGELFHVMDPVMVAAFGKRSFGKSKRGDYEWVEIDLEYGVPIRAYLNGEKPSPPGDQSSLSGWA